MKITIGAFKTREGCKAEVVDVRGQAAIGWIGLTPSQWRSEDGTSLSRSAYQSDLVDVWCDDPKIRAWTEYEVPIGAQMRYTGESSRWLLQVSGTEDDRINWLCDCQHSIDCGVTWKPCGVEVRS